jgi:hypothetical protein
MQVVSLASLAGGATLRPPTDRARGPLPETGAGAAAGAAAVAADPGRGPLPLPLPQTEAVIRRPGGRRPGPGPLPGPLPLPQTRVGGRCRCRCRRPKPSSGDRGRGRCRCPLSVVRERRPGTETGPLRSAEFRAQLHTTFPALCRAVLKMGARIVPGHCGCTRQSKMPKLVACHASCARGGKTARHRAGKGKGV